MIPWNFNYVQIKPLLALYYPLQLSFTYLAFLQYLLFAYTFRYVILIILCVDPNYRSLFLWYNPRDLMFIRIDFFELNVYTSLFVDQAFLEACNHNGIRSLRAL
jgi:hypothetical protein